MGEDPWRGKNSQIEKNFISGMQSLFIDTHMHRNIFVLEIISYMPCFFFTL